MLEYFGLKPSALVSETETTKLEKRKLSITLEALNEVCHQFPETKKFIKEKLDQKYLKENKSVEEIIHFSLTSLEAQS